MKLVVMIPAYNEEETIGTVIEEIPGEIEGIGEVDVLVINDGSTDNTVGVAKEAGADKIVSHATNKGVGAAFSTGLDSALKIGADIVVNIDADGQFNPKDIPKLIKPILDNNADFVTASRFLDKRLEPEMPWIKKFGNGAFTRLVNGLTKQKFTDTQCGFRAYSKEAALRLNLFSNYTYTQEVFLDLANKGLRIKETPLKVSYGGNRQSRVVTNVFLYGVKVSIILIRSIRDYEPLKFFGGIGLSVFTLGFVSGAFLFIRWLFTGIVFPYKSLVDLSVLLLVIGFLLLFLALIADMMDRQRKIHEEMLYKLKKMELDMLHRKK